MSRSLGFDVTARDSASREFLAMAQAVERLEDRLRRLDQLTVNPSAQLNITPATRSAQQLQARLDALRNVRATVEVTGAAEARREVTSLVVEMRKLRNARVRIDIDGNARADVASFAAQLRALRNTRVRVDIEGNALTSVNALANQLRTLRNARVRIDLDGNAHTRVPALATALRTLARDIKVKVGVDDGTFARDIARLHQRVSALSGTTVRINFDIQPPGVRAELESIAESLRRLRGTTSHSVDVDTTAGRRSLNETILSFKLLSAAASLPIAIPGLAAATSSLLSLGGAAVSASGALGLLPAAGAAGGAAMATLALGLAHVGDALGPTGTPAQIEKVEEALASLAPAARDAVGVIRGLGPAFTSMRLEVQQQLFAGLGKEINSVGRTYLPILKTGLGGVAQELNLGAKFFTAWVEQGRTITDVNTILGYTRTTMRELAPAGANVAAALTDIAVVGSAIMPELATGATEATRRFRDFVAQARQTGELEQWIRGGLDVLGQLGTVASNTGGILGGMFRAADAAGADFLSSAIRITGQLDELVNSARGQDELTAVFRESQAAIDALMPGVRDLTGAVLGALGGFAQTQGLQTFTGLLSDTLSVASPLVERLGTLAGETFGNLADGANLVVVALSPIVGLAGGIVDGLGPIAPLAIAAVIAFKTFGLATAAVVALGTAITGTAALTSTLVAGLTGSVAIGSAAAASMTGLGTAVGAVGRALPIVGVAAVGLGFALQGMSTSADQAVTALSAGGQAAEGMRQQLLAQTGQLDANGQATRGLIGDINNWVNSNIFGIASVESATAALEQQRAGMTALQRAQQDVTIAQGNYQAALDDFGARSPQAAAAAEALAGAQQRVALEQIAARNATDLHTAAMIQQSDQALAATDAGLAHERALITLEQAQIRAAQAARDHGVGSLQARDAALAVEEAAMRAAAAAGEKARADGVAAGAANADELAARAQKDELLRLAEANTGPVRQSLLDAAAAIDISASASSRAEQLARTHKDELGRLAEQATGGTATALQELVRGFDTLGGANATAEQRARAQEQALRDMAATASGPLRTELNRMADQIRTLPSGSFTVTANGQLGSMFNPDGSFKGSAGRLATGGVWAGPGRVVRAAGGAVLPGYTPGRDVHSFASPTGGRLELSGGEAVMRPEWTRAVGPAFIAAANRAARTGGIAGVQDFMARTAPRKAGVEGRVGDGSRFASGGIIPTRYTGPVQRLAFGGIVRTGPAYQALVSQDHRVTAEEAARRMAPALAAAIKRYEDAARAAASGSGPVTAGAAAGLAWARTQVGKPYVWGGVGPGGYDCSGFMSAIVNVMRGRSPHSRVGATGTFPWAGFKAGIGPGLNIGSFRGNPGHMAGTIGGVNVESSGGVGVRVGGGARGAGHSMFTTRAHLADRGGLIRSGMAAVNLSGRAERMLSPRQTEVFERLVATLSGPGSGRVDVARAMDVPQGVAGSVAPIASAVMAANGELRSELEALRSQFGALTSAVRDARPINVSSSAADPVEVARAAQWRLRMPS